MVYINESGSANTVWLPKKYGVVDADVKLGILSAEIETNGEYTYRASADGYDGYSKVNFVVNVPCSGGSGFEEGYNSGYTDGFNDGYDQGEEDGFNDGYDSGKTDAWQPAYDSGYTDGYNAAASGNPGYDEGYEVGFDAGYNSGVTDQKNKLTSTAITQNGTYTREDGFNSVYVNVPQTGYTQADLDAAYQSGITYQKSLLTTTAITSNGTYTSQNGFSSVSVSVECPSGITPTGLLLDFTYRTTSANQTLKIIKGNASDDSAALYNFYSAITAIEIDGVLMEKDPNNLKCYTVPSNLCWYEYTFPTAGLHNVKYYMSSAYTALGSLLFSSQNNSNELVAANIGSGFTDVYYGVFQSQANLSSVTLPDGLLRITDYPFEYSGIKSITIPDSVTAITNTYYLSGAFNNCSAMTSVTIGSGITKISGSTFSACTALKTVTITATTPPDLGNYVFQGVSLTHIYVPAGSVSAYKAATNWSSYSNIISAIQ